MYGDKEGTSIRFVVIYAVFVFESGEPPGEHRVIHSAIPYEASLFHPVEPLLQFPDPVFLARLEKSFWLVHVANFVRFEKAVQESGFDVHLVDFPVECSTNVSEDTEQLETSCGR